LNEFSYLKDKKEIFFSLFFRFFVFCLVNLKWNEKNYLVGKLMRKKEERKKLCGKSVKNL
jgi:hypothetical protein